MSKTITFITGNANKLKEVQTILNASSIKLRNHKLDLPELQGEPEEIVRSKCERAMMEVNGPVLIEDTSLCFNALGGMPGPYVKWFLERAGRNGLFKMVESFEDRSAYAMCIFAYQEPGKEAVLLVGKCDGSIVSPRGSTNFGWDPVFQPHGYSQTFAEMDSEEKNKISHRARALRKLQDHLEQQSVS